VTTVSHFRGHLFADLRGSTAFIEKAGNAAGAELVRRFRQLIRDEVDEHSGAEVKSEGDSVYVVFPSASTAVMCGLALLENAARATAEHPELPIHMGVGIHAGEAVEVAEGGYIGSAVNLAARVCAVAEADQVLVTGTVRGIAQASAPIKFVSKGRRRLKGIDEPVDLYQALPAGAAVAAQRRLDRRRIGLVAAGVLGVAAVLAAAFMFWPGGQASSPTPSAQPQPSTRPLEIGDLAIAEYVSDVFNPGFTMVVTDPGWALTGERASWVNFLHEDEPAGRLAIARLTSIHNDPCNPDGHYPIETGHSPADLVAALREVWYLEVAEEVPIQIDRKPGLQVDFRISDGVFAACDLGANNVPLFPLGSETFGAQPGDQLRIEAVPVNGQTVSFLSTTLGGAETPVNRIAEFQELAARLVDGVRFRE
jgi:class 3 adenylate cyclase